MSQTQINTEINEKAMDAYNRDLKTALKRITTFLEPLETHYTGIGIPSLFGWLAVRTGAGIIITSPMGAGKTLIVEIVKMLTEITNGADYIFNVQEFKKTDWKEMLPAHAVDKKFLFLIPEISAMPSYSQEHFWNRIPPLQSDGNFEYRYPSTDKDEGGSIIFENCTAAYAIASQPPKTHAIINDTTFKTLANDRCWNIILLNQLRGSINTPIGDVLKVLKGINTDDGEYTRLLVKVGSSQFKHLIGMAIPKITKMEIKKGVETKVRYWELDEAYVKFINGKTGYRNQAMHITQSSLDVSQFEDCIRNQYSVNRRMEQMNAILKQWGLFLNVPVIKQVHVDLFVALFGFYVNLFNSLTIGSVEQAIDIKYGAVEMLCRVSDLIARNKIVTQHLLTKEFNAKDEDVSHHVSSLVRAEILQENKPKIRKNKPRSHAAKTTRNVRRQAKVLSSVGLLNKRYATKLDTVKDESVAPREVVYSFTDAINGHFTTYASILSDLLSAKVKKGIPQLRKFLSRSKGIGGN